MSRYIPVSTNMDSEDHYHSPYDTNELETEAHYEAPSCLKRNPSGSLFIPSGTDPSPGEKTLPLESRLRYNAYSPHHTIRQGAYSPQHSSTSGSSRREGEPVLYTRENTYSNAAGGNVYNVGTLGTRLGSTLLSRGGVGGGGQNSPARSPNTETYKGVDTNRSTLPNYSSNGQLTGVYHPSTHPQHNGGTGKRPASSSQSGSSHSNSFRLKSDISTRCSWKFVAIFFMLFSFLLVSALIYTAASNYIITGSTGFESAKACAIIEDSRSLDNLLGEESILTKPATLSPSPPAPGPLTPLSGSSLPPDPSTFKSLPLGTRLRHSIPPYTYWNFQLQQPESAYIQFSFAIPRGSSIGLYARRNAIPTLTNNDIRDVLMGFRAVSGQKSGLISRDVRSTVPALSREASYYLDSGHWFLSLYNDGATPHTVEMTATLSADLTSACPRGCSGNGECVMGHCECQAGFDGADCSQSTCPVLCSNNGEYEEGACRCYPGWKGAECSIRHNECEVPDCNNHGNCFNGECQCSRGYTGSACEQVDCQDPSCSSHGFCVSGTCICRKGWRGGNCEQMDDNEKQCRPDCSGHGSFQVEAGKCLCNQGFTGADCSVEMCDLECGARGHCEGGACVCQSGWRGDSCAVKSCDPRCSAHGVCSNGTCLCTNGWNGKHCTLEGCPGNCNGHGACTMPTYRMAWECLCETGWYGPGCSIELEQSCDDKVDNDRDGLVDCEDPECCESPVCERSQLCHTVSAPIDILLRKQPPAVTASFYERMRFIIEDRGLQSYAKKKGFNESRAAVVRGQVITPSGMGLIGVRVSTNGASEGFTMTRDDGWFDLMVNGGGPVMLQFGRNPYSPLRLSLYVPWNEVMVLSPVKLSDQEVHVQVPELYREINTCPEHNFDTMVPIALATWQTNYNGESLRVPGILAESQVVQESLDIPGSDIRLMYHSSRAKGYYSTIQLQLTPDKLPDSLVRVHLIISIEGVQEEQLFEADPNIQYTYAWDRLNIYRQRVYGVTTATIKVGYEYAACSLVWHVQTAKVAGHDMVLSDIGGWNLNVQHKYNFHEGILQKGDGSNIYLKYKPLVVTTLMGDGQQRPLDCSDSECNGPAVQRSLLGPKSLAVAPDGSVFVADHNLIRRITPEGIVTTLLQLNSTRVSYRYHLAHRTYTGELEQRQTIYVSLPEAHTIIKIKSVEDPLPIESNWQPAIGTGERCLPGDLDNCGDGGRATQARLSYPKGIAIGPEGRVYIADGNNIRMVDEFGIISTLAGHQHHRSTWKPLPCIGTIPISEVQLNWPTDMTINPLDGTLHFIDDDMVLQLTKDHRIKIVAGRPLHCHPSQYGPNSPQSAALNEPQSIAFSPTGDMYVAESDSQRINRVRKISNNRQIETIAGKNSNCNCLDISCKCFDPDTHLAATTRFSAISSIAISPDGKLYVADQGNYRIRSVASLMPTSEEDAVFEVPDPDTQELYIFNRFGQHIQTKDIMTQSVLHSMEYHQSTSNGKLVSITDSSGRKLSILRDYSGQVTAIQTSNGQKNIVGVNRMGYLESFERPDSYKVEFQYVSTTGLLLSRLDSQNYGYMFEYDQYGRLVHSVAPTGEITSLAFNLTSQGGNIKVGESVISVNENKVSQTSAATRKETTVAADRTLTVKKHERRMTLATVRHPVISHSHPIIGDSYPMVGEMRVEQGQNLISKVEWDFTLQTSGHDKQMLGINKKMRVNGENLLLVSYDKLQRRELLFLPDKTELLEIKYDEQLRPVTWVAPQLANIGWAPVSQRYDRFGHLEHWRWGEMTEDYTYDKNGRLSQVRKGNATILDYKYDNRDSSPAKVGISSGGLFLFNYESNSGSVKSIATPRGDVHSWSLQPAIGCVRWEYTAPWSTQPYSVSFNARGDILATKLPNGNEQVSYIYGAAGHLLKIFSGQTEMEFGWEDQSGAIESIYVSQGSYEMREKRKYHSGLLKEQKIRFGGVAGFDNANIKYQLDGTGRPSKVNAYFGRRESLESTWKYNQNSGNLEGTDNLQIRRVAFNKTEVQDLNGNFLKAVSEDKYGNLKSIIYTINQHTIFTMELEYNGENRLHRAVVTDHEGRPSEERHSYTGDGQLKQTLGSTNYEFKHDDNGNVVTLSQDSAKTSISYGSGDRVETFGHKKIIYDNNGFVSSVDNQKFLLNAFGKLIEHVTEGGVRVNYYYDQLGRLAAWTDSTGQLTQYFFTNPIKTFQVTYVHNPRNDLTQKLTYDHNNHLVKIESPNEVVHVACDHLGSPLLLFKSSGSVVKRIRYTPYGEVFDDSQPNMNIPIGFRGGINSIHGTFIQIEGRVYEPSIAQWLSPDWISLQNKMETPLDLFVYRFQNNNPVNRHIKHSYMTSMLDWAQLYGFDMDKVLHSSQEESLYQTPMMDHKVHTASLLPHHSVVSELDTLVKSALTHLNDMRFIRVNSEVIDRRRIDLIPHYASVPPNFGRGFLLSLIENNKAVVSPVEVQNSVVQKIFESVLNNSIYLDVSFSDAGKSVYYFVKPSMNQFALDSDTVRRLAGEFTVSPKDISNGKELSIVNNIFEVRILYGSQPNLYRNDLLKTFSANAVKKAWLREKELVTLGFSGHGNWSPVEASQLLSSSHGRVSGYDALELQSADKYPQLSRDGTNFEFVKSGQRNRKNRHGRRKHVAE